MSDFIVHSIPGSPYGRAVMATLEEKGAAWRLHPLAPGTLKQEPHILHHPFGKMPVFEHGDFMLYETQAIQRYIDRILPSPALTPADPKAAARMDQVMNITDHYFFQGMSAVIGFQRVVGPRLLGLTPDEAACAEAMPRAHVVFDELGRLLGDKAYVAGDQPSLADILLACQIDFFDGIPEWGPLTAGNPNLVAWLARMNARPAMRATTWDRVAEIAQAA